MAISPWKTPSYHPKGHHSVVISPPRAWGVRADLHQPSTWVTKLKKLNSNDSCSSPNALPTAVSPRRSSPARPPQRTALPGPTHTRRIPSSSRSASRFAASRRTVLRRARRFVDRASPCARRHARDSACRHVTFPCNIRDRTPVDVAPPASFSPEVS